MNTKQRTAGGGESCAIYVKPSGQKLLPCPRSRGVEGRQEFGQRLEVYSCSLRFLF